MKDNTSKFGILVSVVITAIALGFVASINSVQEGSIQPQGQSVIDYTSTELLDIPDKMQEITSDVIDKTQGIVSDSDSVEDLVDNTSDVIEDTVSDVVPDVPPIIKKNDGKLLELVSISVDTGVSGCDDSNLCYTPFETRISPGGEVIWTNNDIVPHTVTAGNPHDGGPNGLFNSGLIMPDESYSIQLDLASEYDYFCLVHPWMQGTIVVG